MNHIDKAKKPTKRSARTITSYRPDQQKVLWLRDFLFYRIPVAASYMLRETSRVCRSQNPPLTTAQWRIISILANHHSIVGAEISRISMLDQVAVSRALAVLTRRGFVQRQRNRKDKRTQEVSLTPAGWRYYGLLMPAMQEENEAVRQLFNESELKLLYRALDQIDRLFMSLDAQRRLYGDDVKLRDVAQKKFRTGPKESGRYPLTYHFCHAEKPVSPLMKVDSAVVSRSEADDHRSACCPCEFAKSRF